MKAEIYIFYHINIWKPDQPRLLNMNFIVKKLTCMIKFHGVESIKSWRHVENFSHLNLKVSKSRHVLWGEDKLGFIFNKCLPLKSSGSSSVNFFHDFLNLFSDDDECGKAFLLQRIQANKWMRKERETYKDTITLKR